MAYAIKANKQPQLNISQPTSTISSVPTLHEFFVKLNKDYDAGDNDYLKLERHLQEKN
ncbi:3947_t:CDS:1, partial [Dentiscutata erythropus]